MDTFVQIAVIISAFAFVGMGLLLLGISLGRNQGLPSSRDEINIGLQRQNQQLTSAIVDFGRQAMNMASVIPDQQLDRINAEAIAEAARTGKSPIDLRREQERQQGGDYDGVDWGGNPAFDEPPGQGDHGL
jgi:hypothetical protein